MQAVLDPIKWRIDWTIRKYDEEMTAWLREQLGYDPTGVEFDIAKLKPYETNLVPGNLLTTAGVARAHGLITGVGGLQAASGTAARIGVGDGSGTAAIGDTDLSASSGSTHRQFVLMDASFPTAGTVMTWQSTFTSALGNFAWSEFGIDIGTPTVANGTTVAACLLNHKTGIAQGTKTSGQSWVASAAVTLS